MAALSDLLQGDHPFRIAFIAIAGTAMLLEYLFSRLNDHDTHDAAETAASLLIALGNKVIGAATAAIAAAPLLWLWQWRLFDIAMTPVAWVALFLAVDLCYYVHHLAMHKVRWLWATHAVHHSPTRLNLTAGIRLGWGGQLTGGILFYAPLVLFGFHPLAVLAMLGLGLAYQFLLHLAHPPRLGPLEFVLNTPRHHRVHHASNDACLDRNFGGVLIVFDRLFGTFAEPPPEPLRFGLKGVPPRRNPLSILSGEWASLIRDVRTAPGIAGKLRVLVRMP